MTITLTFTESPDRFIVGTAGSYDLSFLGGGDALIIQSGTTTAHMGDGDDFVRVEAGTATLFGDDGADRFDLYASGTRVAGGAGNDIVNVRGGENHVVAGGSGDDRFNFFAGASGEALNGGDGNDMFVNYGVSVGGALYGDAGDDRFYGFANSGGRTVTLFGGAGNDLYRIENSASPTIVELAAGGIDKVQLASGLSYTLPDNLENLVVLAGGTSAASTLTGNLLANHITGGLNSETINGLDGNDVLAGGAGDDMLFGGDGNDRITGGLGADALQGGSGRDVFVYTSVQDSGIHGNDVVTDFDVSGDRLDLSAIDANALLAGKQDLVFGGTGIGHLHLSYDTFWWHGVWLEADTDGDGMSDLSIHLQTPYLSVPHEDNLIL